MTVNSTLNDVEDTITHLSDEYLAKSLKISEIQLVKGGYRLANVINQIWGSQTSQQQYKAIQDSQREVASHEVPLTK